MYATTPARVWTAAAVLAASVFVTTIATQLPNPEAALAASGTISGTVFEDWNSNGKLDLTANPGRTVDAGVEGIEVRAFDSTGASVGSTTSGANGTYSLNVATAATTDIRVEFNIPTSDASLAPYVPASAVATAQTGTLSSTSVQFVTLGATGVNFGVIDPTKYCESNPQLMTCMHPYGDGANVTSPGAIVFGSQMSNPGSAITYDTTTVQGLSDDLGSVFGIGIDRSGSRTTAPNAFIGNYVKRHVEYGDAGATNTIYRLPLDGSTSVSSFITLNDTVLPAHTKTSVGSWPDYGEDTSVFTSVGRIGLGDVDVTPDGSTLLAVDMDENDPRLYTVPLIGWGDDVQPGAPSSVSIPQPATFNGVACPGKWHPMGIGVRGSRVLVGGVCGAENTVSGAAPRGPDPTTSTAFVLELNAASGAFSTIFAMSLGYERPCAYNVAPCSNATSVTGGKLTADWGAWNETPNLDYVAGPPERARATNPQAMLANIEIADNGDLILDFRDRYGDQAKSSAMTYSTDSAATGVGELHVMFSAGDMVRACRSGTSFALEAAGTCAGGLQGSAALDPGGSREFYYDAFPYFDATLNSPNYHPETSNGSSATLAGYSGVWTTAYDINAVNQQGVLSYGNCNILSGSALTNCEPSSSTTGYGSRLGGISFPYPTTGTYKWTSDATFGKGNGLADLEVICDQAPLQIGNRVWIDTDRDGIQDPGETPVAGVTVRLYDDLGTLVGTAITNEVGEYLFTSTNGEAADGGGASADEWGGGLEVGKTYTVRLDEPTDYEAGGPLEGYTLTDTDSATAEPTDVDDRIDNDSTLEYVDPANPGAEENPYPTISVGSMGPGTNDHSFDFGFVTPLVAMGDYTWIDSDEDGVQDAPADEPPLAGVTVTLYESDGTTPAEDASGDPATAVTDANGYYFIDNLLPGEYVAGFEVPNEYVLTTDLAGADSAIDSNPDPATGLTPVFTIAASETGETVLDIDPDTAAAFVNPTIDAGVVPAPLVGMGDFTWIDADQDGLQGEEAPLEGVVVTLYEQDGTTAATDASGAPATDTTDETGYYFIDNLYPGDYVAEFTLPAGYSFTADLIGTDTGIDSNPDPATGVTPVFTIHASAVDETVVDSDETTIAEFVNPTIDAGVVPVVAVGDYTWIDTNEDGLQGDRVDEPPLEGVTVTLYESDGTTPVDNAAGDPATAVTDANGYYFIDNLYPGDYVAEFTLPTGFTFTQDLATPGADDSNPDPTTGQTPTFTLVPEVSGDMAADTDETTVALFVDPTIDAGVTPPPLVGMGDYTWIDTNQDGLQDGDELPLEGVTVNLLKRDGETAATTASGDPATDVTDANGYYFIDGLYPGDYTAEFVLPSGYTFTQDLAGSDTEVDSNPDPVTGVTAVFPIDTQVAGETQADTDGATAAEYVNPTIDAGVVPVVAMGDYTWIDTDENGLQGDPSVEPPLAGVTVTLYEPDGTTPAEDAAGDPATDTTDENGYYFIDNLYPGDYVAEFTLPYGFTFTQDLATPGGTDSNPDPTTGVTPLFTLVAEASGEMVADVDADTVAVFVDPTIDAGVIPPPLVGMGDYTWIDTNEDGVQDDGEEPLAGVTVTLYESDGVTPAETAAGDPATDTTDSNGLYFIDGLYPGDYVAEFDLPAGYSFTQDLAGTDTEVDSNPDPATGVTPVFTIDIEVTGETVADIDELTLAEFVNPTIDAGVVEIPLVAVGDYTWIDANNNGVQDDGEEPLEGVTVTLYESDGTTPAENVAGDPATDTTDVNGYYFIDALFPGDYVAEFTLPSGYVFTQDVVGEDDTIDSNPDPATGLTSVFTVTDSVAGDTVADIDETTIASFVNPTIDAGVVEVPLVGMGDYTWIDSDRDGQQDLSEAPLAGVVVTLYETDGTTPVTDANGDPATATTNDAGFYFIDALDPGDYRALFELPDGYGFTDDLVAPNATDSNPDPATGLTPAFTITAAVSGDTVVDSEPLTVAKFHNPTIDAGVVPLVAMGDYTWIDTDRDGLQDAGEEPLAGVTVTLVEADGTTPVDDVHGTPAADVTDANGYYFIDALLPGDYRAQFTLPDGYVFTADDGGVATTDSNPDPMTGLTPTFTIALGVTGNTVADTDTDTRAVFVNPTIDAGVIEVVAVGDYVWVDTDRDGVQDAGEAPLAGVTVTLVATDGTTPVDDVDGNPATAVTDEEGFYLIDNLLPGDYRAQFTLPDGFEFTIDDSGVAATDSNPDPGTGLTPTFAIEAAVRGDTVADDDPDTVAVFVNPTVDAGVVTDILVAVGNYVWIDADRDGLQDADESPLGGVVVTLFEAGSDVLALDVDGDPATAMTDGEGYYVIDALLPGRYVAEFRLPNGYSFTQALTGDPTLDSNPSPDDAGSIGRTSVFTLRANVAGLMIADLDPGTRALFVDPTVDAGVVRAVVPSRPGGWLPTTGGPWVRFAWFAGLLLAAGAALVTIGRRRRTA